MVEAVSTAVGIGLTGPNDEKAAMRQRGCVMAIAGKAHRFLRSRQISPQRIFELLQVSIHSVHRHYSWADLF